MDTGDYILDNTQGYEDETDILIKRIKVLEETNEFQLRVNESLYQILLELNNQINLLDENQKKLYELNGITLAPTKGIKS